MNDNGMQLIESSLFGFLFVSLSAAGKMGAADARAPDEYAQSPY